MLTYYRVLQIYFLNLCFGDFKAGLEKSFQIVQNIHKNRIIIFVTIGSLYFHRATTYEIHNHEHTNPILSHLKSGKGK